MAAGALSVLVAVVGLCMLSPLHALPAPLGHSLNGRRNSGAQEVHTESLLTTVMQGSADPRRHRDAFGRWTDPRLSAANGPFTPAAAVSTPFTVTAAAELLWNVTDDVVGKVSSLAISTNFVVTGSTFLPAQRVTTINLTTGAVTQLEGPDFTNAVSVSASGHKAVVLACAEVDATCVLSSFATAAADAAADAAAAAGKPTWKKNITGSMFWSGQGVEVSNDGNLVALGLLSYRPSVTSAVPGSLVSLDGTTGAVKAEVNLTATMGEVAVDRVHNRLMASREFSSVAGTIVVANTATGHRSEAVLDKYVVVAFDPKLDVALVPKDNEPTTIELVMLSTAKVVWDFTKPSPAELFKLVLSDTYAVAGWYTPASHSVEFAVFDHSSSKSYAQTTITLPTSVPSYEVANILVSMTDGAAAHLALGINGVGVLVADVTSATGSLKAVTVLEDKDTCGFESLAISSPSTGAVVVAGINQRVAANECLAGAGGLVAVRVPKNEM